jgi:hypothetical protein
MFCSESFFKDSWTFSVLAILLCLLSFPRSLRIGNARLSVLCSTQPTAPQIQGEQTINNPLSQEQPLSGLKRPYDLS